MSRVNPGWYPDPTGRHAQRYHDGSAWTDHVVGTDGRRTVSPVAGTGAGTGAEPAGNGAGYQEASPGRSVWSDRPEASTQEWRAYAGEQPSRADAPGATTQEWQAYAAQQDAQAGQQRQSPYGDAPGATTQEWQAYAAQQDAQAGQQKAYVDAPGATTQEWQAYAGQQGAAARGQGQAWPGQQQPAPQQRSWPGQSPGYGQQPYGAARSPAQADDTGFTFTIGVIVAAVGAVLLLASLFALDFVTFSFGDVSESFPLGDLRSSDQIDTSEAGRAGQYIEFGFVPALIVVAGAVFVQFLDREHPARRGLTVATVIVMFWHLLAMFQWDTAEGESVSPAIGAWVGVVGYLCLAASPWLTQRLSQSR